MKSFLRSQPLFIFLLPIFFVFHGFVGHYYFIPIKDAALLVLLYIMAAIIITGISWLFYRNIIKSALVCFYLLCFFFFFGGIQDFLRHHFVGTFFSRYSFILLFAFLIFIGLIFWLKRRAALFMRITFYLNILFLLFTCIDIFYLVKKISEEKTNKNSLSAGFSSCDSCAKPDIFFIILDEYASNKELKEFFNFDNSDFEHQLTQQGFHISKESRSNYNYTPFSIASILNMNYPDLNMTTKAPGNINYCYQQIKKSEVVNYLMANGYEFYNYSVFDFEGELAIHDNFLPSSTELITAQTFFKRVISDIQFNIGTGKWRFKAGLKKITYEHLHNNEKIMRLTKEIASHRSDKPKFIYAHLMMPHYPYYFNSKNEPLPIEQLYEGQEVNKQNYTEYLQYCNQRILELINEIFASAKQPPVVMLLGDHGFRHVEKKEDHKYAFMNLNAIYLPDKNYSKFYDSISNVNQFRVFFNTEFGQQLPLLKDSTVYLWGD